jgi:mono/diheme cytochrome c family protein
MDTTAREIRFARRLLLLVATALLLSAAECVMAEDHDPVARGRYLVVEVARCGDCHTPTTGNGEPDKSHWLEGAPVLPPFAACVKLPPGVASISKSIAGLPTGWSKEQLARFLETGTTPNGVPARPFMPEYRLNPEDATAIASYLRSLRR